MARYQSNEERKAASRRATKDAITRELCCAGILARIWPSYLTEPKNIKQNPNMPALLCVDSPADLLVWRLSLEELEGFKGLPHLPYRENDGRPAADKTVALYTLAFDGW